MTPAQTRILRLFDSHGLFDPGGTVTDPYRNKGRTLERMAKVGLVKPYVHGGYELTAAGYAAKVTAWAASSEGQRSLQETATRVREMNEEAERDRREAIKHWHEIKNKPMTI